MPSRISSILIRVDDNRGGIGSIRIPWACALATSARPWASTPRSRSSSPQRRAEWYAAHPVGQTPIGSKLDDAQLAKLQGAGDKKRAAATGDITRERMAALTSAETRSATASGLQASAGRRSIQISGLMETKRQGAISVVGRHNEQRNAYQPIISASASGHAVADHGLAPAR